jgi:ubiquinone/menaquinone biosynthesis C-methylase UbiE
MNRLIPEPSASLHGCARDGATIWLEPKAYKADECGGAGRLAALARELHERAKELGLDVRELSPEMVRQRLTGNPKSTKYEVANTSLPGLGDCHHWREVSQRR